MTQHSRRGALIASFVVSQILALVAVEVSELRPNRQNVRFLNERWAGEQWLAKRVNEHSLGPKAAAGDPCTSLIVQLGLASPEPFDSAGFSAMLRVLVPDGGMSPAEALRLAEERRQRIARMPIGELPRRDQVVRIQGQTGLPYGFVLKHLDSLISRDRYSDAYRYYLENLTDRPITATDSLLLVAPSPCGFKNEPLPRDPPNYRRVIDTWLGVTLHTFPFLVGIAFGMTYSHAGWRRLATVVAAAGAPIAWLAFLRERFSDFPWWYLLLAAASAIISVVLVAREAVLWVKKGF